jgi:hypothetical protein
MSENLPEAKVVSLLPKARRIERIKGHLERHKVAYSVGAGVVLTAAVFAVTKRISLQTLPLPTYMDLNTASKRLGRPSHIVKDLTTGEMWGSQGATARARGFSQSTLSKHLIRGTSDIRGHKYTVVGRLFV